MPETAPYGPAIFARLPWNMSCLHSKNFSILQGGHCVTFPNSRDWLREFGKCASGAQKGGNVTAAPRQFEQPARMDRDLDAEHRIQRYFLSDSRTKRWCDGNPSLFTTCRTMAHESPHGCICRTLSDLVASLSRASFASRRTDLMTPDGSLPLVQTLFHFRQGEETDPCPCLQRSCHRVCCPTSKSHQPRHSIYTYMSVLVHPYLSLREQEGEDSP